MRKYTKKLLVLLCALTCSLGLTGCHGSKGMDAFVMPQTFDESQSYEITFWAKNDNNQVQTAIYQKAIADFEKAYPNVKVNMRLYTDYNTIYNDVITNISTNTTPNVCITYPDHIATYMTGTNVVVPLDDVFADARYGLGGSEINYDSVAFDEVVPEFLNECRLGDVYYAIPYMRSTEACYINKDFVEKLGYTVPDVLTWDFIWEVSEAATKKDADGNFAINGQSVMIPFIYKSTDNMMIQYLKQSDAGYSTSEGDIQIFNDTTEGLLMDCAEHAKSRAFSTFKISSYPANFLNAGQCIFAVDSTAGSTWMGSKAPLLDIAEDKLVDFETVVRLIPQVDPQSPQMISQGPSICIFNKEDPQEVLASWLFAQFMLTNDVQTAYAKTEGYVPVTLKAQNSEEYRDYLSKAGIDGDEHYQVKIDATQLLIDNVGNTFTTPVFNGSASLRNAAGQMIENVVNSSRRNETVNDAYIDNLYSDVTSLYRLNQIGANANSSQKQDLGKMPQTATALLLILLGVWVLIGIYVLIGRIKSKKEA